jgi:hypothetical protein
MIQGYDIITGLTWYFIKQFNKKGFCNKLFLHLINSKTLVLSALEIPDSPRLNSICSDKSILECLVFLNAFSPNTVLYINSGFEFLEAQPMNLGLENDERGRFVLEPQHPLYGKLAFFDNYKLDWLNVDSYWMLWLLKNINYLRNELKGILKKENFVDEKTGGKFFLYPKKPFRVIFY